MLRTPFSHHEDVSNGEQHNSDFSFDCLFSCLLDKDVTRTDRTHPSFQGENNPNISVLYDILMTYCMYNFDLGESGR